MAWTEEQQRRCYGVTQAELEAQMRGLRERPFYDGDAFTVMSMLSDVQEMIEHGMKEEARQRLNCAKFILGEMHRDYREAMRHA